MRKIPQAHFSLPDDEDEDGPGSEESEREGNIIAVLSIQIDSLFPADKAKRMNWNAYLAVVSHDLSQSRSVNIHVMDSSDTTLSHLSPPKFKLTTEDSHTGPSRLRVIP